MSAPIVSVAAPAKLNLYLHVTGKRDDGYHLLDSLIAFADVGDEIKARTAADGSLTLTVRGPFAKDLADETDNLVLRAARRLREVAGIEAGAHLVLEKRLPVASGIGGGSADAAAALKALCRLWGVEMAEAEMRALALDLGADVPVCWVGRPAFIGGIGGPSSLSSKSPRQRFDRSRLRLVPGRRQGADRPRRDGGAASGPHVGVGRDLLRAVRDRRRGPCRRRQAL